MYVHIRPICKCNKLNRRSKQLWMTICETFKRHFSQGGKWELEKMRTWSRVAHFLNSGVLVVVPVGSSLAPVFFFRECNIHFSLVRGREDWLSLQFFLRFALFRFCLVKYFETDLWEIFFCVFIHLDKQWLRISIFSSLSCFKFKRREKV